jgi:hypothetical protein
LHGGTNWPASTVTAATVTGESGGNYGGGGAGGSWGLGGAVKGNGREGGNGVVRIIWPGSSRTYPSTNTGSM